MEPLQTDTLYDQILENDAAHLARLRVDARNAGQGVKTGFMLHSRNMNGEVKEIELWIPKFAITLICARTGGGKTSWMTNLTMRMAMEGATGFFITLEEPGFAIRAKMMAAYSYDKNQRHTMMATNSWKATKVIAGYEQCAEESDFNREVMQRVRIVDANQSVELDHIESPTIMYNPQWIADLIKHRNAKSQKPLDFVVIDFGQLMETTGADNSNSYQRMKGVMQACKNLSGALGIAVIVGAQLQRACHSIPIWDWEPEMIRDGSDMEQAASLVLATGQDKNYSDKTCNMVLRYLKNRNGPKRVAGMFSINFEHNFIPLKGMVPEDD